MPLYEYRCEACEHRFEVIRRFSDPPLAVCTACGQGPVVKLLSSPAFQFKGTGWYITDYARKGKEGGEKGEKGEKKDATPQTKDSGSDSGSKSSESASSTPSPAAAPAKDGA
jgi:putative FmdB family regulatory protein